LPWRMMPGSIRSAPMLMNAVTIWVGLTNSEKVSSVSPFWTVSKIPSLRKWGATRAAALRV
jgi:hypothetical protein